MATDNTIEVTLQDLRAIIHGLRMSTFAFVEPDALENIQMMIKTLPGPEELNAMAESPQDLKQVQEDVGGIMRLVEIYGRRGPESKARYKARTDLPPRYPVMAWRSKMKTEAREVVKMLVTASSTVDEKGNGKIADHLIKCAKKVQSNELMERDIDKAVDLLKEAGFNKEADLFLEAQVGQYMKSMWDTAKGMGSQLAHKFMDPARLEKTKAKLQNVLSTLKEEMQYGQEVASSSQDPNVTASIKALVDSMSQMSVAGNQALATLQQVQQSGAQGQSQAQSQGQPQASANPQGGIGGTISSLQNALQQNPNLDKYQQNALQQAIKALERAAPQGQAAVQEKTPVTPQDKTLQDYKKQYQRSI